MAEIDYDQAVAKAAEIGREHGKNEVASWWWAENGSTQDAEAILAYGLLEVFDAEVLPQPDLSGEWADGMTPLRLADEIGWFHADHTSDVFYETLEDICDAYENAFHAAVHAEIERMCREVLSDSVE